MCRRSRAQRAQCERAPELSEVTRRYLRGRVVYIICDSDWTTISEVRDQAFQCQRALRKLGAIAYVAAPPATIGDKIGVDDHLGKGGKLSELVVVEREPAFGLAEYQAKYGWKHDKTTRNAEILNNLAKFADDSGRIRGSIRSLAKKMDTYPKRVARALEDLKAIGVIEIEGELAAGPQWRGKGYDWIGEWPTVTIVPELRASTKTHVLGSHIS